jgi:hypothetical protein
MSSSFMASCLSGSVKLLMRAINYAFKNLLRPFVNFAMAALRTTVIVGSIAAVIATSGGFGENLAIAVALTGTWALAFYLVLNYEATQTVGIVNEMIMVALVGCKTVFALDQIADPTDSMLDSTRLWYIPIYALIFYLALGHVLFNWIEDRPLPDATITYRTSYAISITTLAVAFAMVPLGLELDYHLTSISGVIIIIETGLFVLLMFLLVAYQEHETDDVWQGGSLMLLQWLALQVVTLPLGSPIYVVSQIVMLIAVVAFAILMTRDVGPEEPPAVNRFIVALPFKGAWALLLALAELTKTVLSSVRTYQVSILFNFTVILGTMNKPWFYTHCHFPQGIRKICEVALFLIDDVVSIFYKYTNRPDIQNILKMAGQAIGGVRATAYNVITPIYKWLVRGQVGVEHTYIPTDSMLSLLAFLIGPCLACAGVLVQVFPQGAMFARSRWFWAVCFFGNVLFFLASTVVPGVEVTVVHTVFPKSEYERSYSSNGQAAYISEALLALSCIVLFMITNASESEETKITSKLISRIRQKQQLTLTASQLTTLIQRYDAEMARAGSSPQAMSSVRQRREQAISKEIKQIQQQGISAGPFGGNDDKQKPSVNILTRIYDMATSPAAIVFATGVMWLIGVIVSTGSPIKGIHLLPIPTGAPNWLISTPFDQAGVMADKLVTLLLAALGWPDPRFPIMMMLLIVKEMGCVACLCISMDWINDIGDAFSSFGGLFGRRRRLLMDNRDWQYAFQYGNSTLQQTLQRRLLQQEPEVDPAYNYEPDRSCSGSSSCSGIYFCLSDVLDDIADIVTVFFTLMMKGLNWVIEKMIALMLDLASGLKPLNAVFGDIKGILTFADFDIMDDVDLNFRFEMFGMDWGIFPNIENPLPSLSDFLPSMTSIIIALVLLGIALWIIFRMGLMEPVLTATVTAAALAAVLSVVGVIIALLVLASWMLDTVREYGYKVDVRYKSNIALYAIGMGILAYSGFLVVGAATATHLQTLQQELDAEEEDEKEDSASKGYTRVNTRSSSPPSIQ